MKTIKSNQSAVMFNNLGGSTGFSYEKGTSIDEIINDCKNALESSKNRSWDRMNRDVLKPFFVMYSDATGKELRRIDL